MNNFAVSTLVWSFWDNVNVVDINALEKMVNMEGDPLTPSLLLLPFPLRLHQTASDYIRLSTDASDCIRLHQTVHTCIRLSSAFSITLLFSIVERGKTNAGEMDASVKL